MLLSNIKLCVCLGVVPLLFLNLADCTSRQFRFDYTYVPDVEGWVKLHKVPATWDNAWLHCFREGSILASPENNNLALLMTSMAKDEDVSSCGVYTGIHAKFYKGFYHSVEGTPLSKLNVTWAPGEPDNFEDREQCLMMLLDGTMVDVDCDNVYPFFCYKKRSKLMFLNPCGTIDNDYEYHKKTDRCYKFHRFPQNWTQAFAACSGEGGHLAIINSDEEAQVIKDIYSNNPDSFMPGNFKKYMAYIGMSDWGQRGIWLTVHGQTLKEAGYDIWEPSEPTDSTLENCGAVYRSGKLGNTWCNTGRPFICEKASDSLISEDEF